MSETKIVANRLDQTAEFTFSELALGNGTVSNPAVAFTNGQGSGMFLIGSSPTEQLNFACRGVNVLSSNSVGLFANISFQTIDGTSSVPAITFASDPNTGFYRSATDTIAVTVGGVAQFQFDPTQFYTSLPCRGPVGAASIPTYTFASDPDTGMYQSALNNLNFSANGAVKLSCGPVGVYTSVPLYAIDGTLAAPSISFDADSNTGFYRNGTDEFRAVSGGTSVMDFFNTGITCQTIFELTNGTQAAPAIAFASELGVGIAHESTGFMTFTYNNTAMLRMRGVNGDIRFGLTPVAPSGGLDLGTDTDFWRRIYLGTGSAAGPSVTFTGDNNTGFYLSGGDQISISLGGTSLYTWAATRFIPPDNTLKLGDTSNRWTAVYAVNGTIQTSHSSTKENIVEVDANIVPLPQAVEYDRDGRRYLGYLNDNIPATGRPVDSKGNICEKDNYEQAVIGILCAHVKNLEARIKTLEG